MNHKWIDRFMGLAKTIAAFSKDPDCKVGAVIVNPKRIMISSGYNGFPYGIEDRHERLTNKTVKRELTLHAETNAILNADVDLYACAMFITKPPCIHCALMVIQSGISMIVMPKLDAGSSWFEQNRRAMQLLCEAGIRVIEVENSNV